jgi:hypothetical protein
MFDYDAKVAELKSEIQAEIDRLQRALKSLGGGEVGNGIRARRGRGKAKKTMSSVIKQAKKGKRIRRSPENLAKDAAEVIAIIKSKGKEGAKGSDFARFKIIGSPKVWLKQHARDAKIKTTGEKSKMRYHLV